MLLINYRKIFRSVLSGRDSLQEGELNMQNALNTELSMKLKDSRQLGFAEYGEPHGKPILFFHGLAGSRLDARLLHKIAITNHCRLISIDRPGMGLSSFDKKRTILSWADDVEAFADHFNLPKFAIIGHSGGAPFVAACLYKIPERLTGAAIVSGMGPFELPAATASLTRGQRFLNSAIRKLPWIATCCMKLTRWMFKNPNMLKQGLKQMAQVDSQILQSEGNIEVLGSTMMETFRQGVAGVAQEMQLTLNPWGFNLEAINATCPITIWQGGLDKQAPAIHAELYAQLIPNAKLTFFKQEGHLSLLVNKGEEILQSITI